MSHRASPVLASLHAVPVACGFGSPAEAFQLHREVPQDYIAGNTRGNLRWRAQRLQDIKVAVVGDTAVLTAAVTDEVSQDGHDQAFHLRLTQVWVRTPEGWRCLAGHASRPAE